jgi:hypothetical protein
MLRLSCLEILRAPFLRAPVTKGKAETECFLPQCACCALHRFDDRPYGRFVLRMGSKLALVIFRPGPSYHTPLCLLGHSLSPYSPRS